MLHCAAVAARESVLGIIFVQGLQQAVLGEDIEEPDHDDGQGDGDEIRNAALTLLRVYLC